MCLLVLVFTTASCTLLKGEKDTDSVEEVVNEETSRFIVSFYSPGNGIDRPAKTKFDKFLGDFEPAITYSTTRWGREGEVDYCFDLEELNAEEQEAFIEEVKQLLAKSKKVRFSENELCRSERK
mgnify:FL=1